MRSLFRDLVDSVRNPEFWALSSWLDIVAKARQSRLGIFWLLAPSNLYVWGLGGFFSSLMGRELVFFAAHIALGSMIFRLLTTVIIESTTVFGANQAFIMDGHVRLTDFLLRVLAKAAFHFLMAVPVIAIALWLYPELQYAGFLWAMLSFPLIVLNALWIGFAMALLGSRFPDISQLMGSVFIFAFLLTPIVWYAEWAPADSLRGSLMRINPLFHMIEVVRAPILGEPLEMLSIYYLGVMTVVGWTLATFLYRRYARFVPIWI